MDEPRLKAKLRVQAMLRQASAQGSSAAVLRRGDADAGGILAVLRGRTGLAVLVQQRDAEGQLGWWRATGPAPVDQTGCDAYINRQVNRDPDLWVVEFDSPELSQPFA